MSYETYLKQITENLINDLENEIKKYRDQGEQYPLDLLEKMYSLIHTTYLKRSIELNREQYRIWESENKTKGKQK